jgi:hypothetical protein
MLRMQRGDTPIFDIAVVDVNGDPLDVSSAYVWFTAKYNYGDLDDDAVFQKTVGNGIFLTNSAYGEMSIQLDSSDTAAILDKTRLKYDVQIKDISGSVYTVATGLLSVEPDVTRSIS